MPSEQPVCVWCRFRHPYDWACDQMKQSRPVEVNILLYTDRDGYFCARVKEDDEPFVRLKSQEPRATGLVSYKIGELIKKAAAKARGPW